MIIKGTILEIVYKNEENNYTVIGLEVGKDKLTATGYFPDVFSGMTVELQGNYKDTKYGKQFQADSIKISNPTTINQIERYLSSGLIKGIGPVTAKKITSMFGADTLSIIEYNPQKLALIRGISKQKAIEIATSFQDVKKMQDSLLFLSSYGISVNLSIKIYNMYKEDTIETVKNNPYKLIEDIDGIGFITADNIAKKLGMNELDINRIKAGILHVLKTSSEREGNTYLKLEELKTRTSDLLNLTNNEQKFIDDALDIIQIENLVKIFNYAGFDIVISTKFYYYENYIAKKLFKLSHNIFESTIDINKNINFYEKLANIKLNDEQIQAVITSLTNGVTVITGGPGTGKTTILRCILALFDEMGINTMLLAPTGRASKRMQESTKKEAKTIHRALEVVSNGNGLAMFHRNEMNPINADVIIVDEMSMVDISIFYHLLKATKSTTKLILVGDKDQLPSVSAGNVLKDIIDSNCIKVCSLKQIYRQDENSLIVTNAHLINTGKMPIINNQSNDFFYESGDNLIENAEKIVDLVSHRIPHFLNIEPDKIQVLTPMKNGPCGSNNLNSRLQQILNPHYSGIELQDDFVRFRVGDKVMQIVNNYDLEYTRYENSISIKGQGVYNGDIGQITHITPQTYETTVEYDDGKICVYPRSELSQITLAYSITIHKSQGSEFDVVVIPLIPGAPMIITRNLLYTAITRAKKMVVLVGSKKNLSRMIYNNYTAERYTLLKYFIKDEFSKSLTTM